MVADTKSSVLVEAPGVGCNLRQGEGGNVNFNSILIGSAEPQRLVDYYTKLFGAPWFQDGGYAGWQIGSGFVSIGPHDQVKGSNSQPGRLIWNIESKDVKADFERFKAAGATVVTEPYEFEGAPGSLIATFADPDGNYFQLTSPFEM
jgi:predicted enzyme related to lactoylglutathione lyase